MNKDTLPKINVQWFNKVNHLCEIYSTGLQRSFINEKNEQCHQMTLCLDFGNEVVAGALHNKSYSIYGFNYDPKVNPSIDFNNTRFLWGNKKDKNFLDKIENIIDFIHPIEEILNYKKTEIFLVENPTKGYHGMIVTIGSRMWMKSPPLLSLYSLLIKVGLVHTPGNDWKDTIRGIINGKIKPYQINDKDYLKKSVKGIEKILNLRHKIFYINPKNNFPENVNTSTLHNSSGIVAFSEGRAKSIKKGWYRAELEEEYNNIPIDKKVVIIY